MSGNLKYLNDQDFDSAVAQGVTLVDFYADWCGPCRMMEPILHELADEVGERAAIAKVDIESAQATAAKFNVTSIPTLILFKDGEEMKRVVGVKDKESLAEEINAVCS